MIFEWSCHIPANQVERDNNKKTTLEVFLFLAGWSDATFATVGCSKVY